jgi:hypothetical protein
MGFGLDSKRGSRQSRQSRAHYTGDADDNGRLHHSETCKSTPRNHSFCWRLRLLLFHLTDANKLTPGQQNPINPISPVKQKEESKKSGRKLHPGVQDINPPPGNLSQQIMAGSRSPPSKEQRKSDGINEVNGSLNSDHLSRTTFLEDLGDELFHSINQPLTPASFFPMNKHTCGTLVAAKMRPPMYAAPL